MTPRGTIAEQPANVDVRLSLMKQAIEVLNHIAPPDEGWTRDFLNGWSAAVFKTEQREDLQYGEQATLEIKLRPQASAAPFRIEAFIDTDLKFFKDVSADQLADAAQQAYFGLSASAPWLEGEGDWFNEAAAHSETCITQDDWQRAVPIIEDEVKRIAEEDSRFSTIYRHPGDATRRSGWTITAGGARYVIKCFVSPSFVEEISFLALDKHSNTNPNGRIANKSLMFPTTKQQILSALAEVVMAISEVDHDDD